MQQNARKQSEKATEIAAAAALANGCSVDDLKNSMQTNGNNSDDNNNNSRNNNSKWHCFVPESCNSSIDGLKITHTKLAIATVRNTQHKKKTKAPQLKSCRVHLASWGRLGGVCYTWTCLEANILIMKNLQLSSDRQRRLAATDWHLQKLKAQKNAQAFKADEEKIKKEQPNPSRN